MNREILTNFSPSVIELLTERENIGLKLDYHWGLDCNRASVAVALRGLENK
jgi:hypothetical protein